MDRLSAALPVLDPEQKRKKERTRDSQRWQDDVREARPPTHTQACSSSWAPLALPRGEVALALHTKCSLPINGIAKEAYWIHRRGVKPPCWLLQNLRHLSEEALWQSSQQRTLGQVSPPATSGCAHRRPVWKLMKDWTGTSSSC